MLLNARCWKRQAAALAIVMILLNACARVDSDGPPSLCPPVVEYSRAEQLRLANELTTLSEDAAIVDWLADYAVLRGQARSC